LLSEARKRVNQNPDQYFPHIFGEQEAGGSSILMIASKDLVKLGIKIPAATRPLPNLTALGMESVPPVGLATGAILLGLWWSFKRRQEVAEAERNGKKDGHGK
jgi:formate dehydrogenase iron-sulfur subunit